MNNQQVNKLVRDSLANFAINTASRIQSRRQRNGKRTLIKKNLSAMPRRQGGLGKGGGINPRVVARTVASNIGTSVSGLQSTVTQIIAGSEKIGDLKNNSGTAGFGVIYSASLNPAEPGLAPSCAASANQYQKFKTRTLKLTYTPTASTSTNGTLYVAVYADPKTPPPTSVDDMVATGNMKQFPVYGTAQTWTIDPSSLQNAYLVQSVKTPAVYNLDEPTNSSGMVFAACDGVAVNTVLGTLTWTYGYQLSVKRLGTGANTLTSYHLASRFPNGLPICFDEGDLQEGHAVLSHTTTDGDYSVRIRSAPTMIVVTTQDDTAALGVAVSYSQDNGANWTLVGAHSERSTENVSTVYGVRMAIVPPCTHVRLHNAGVTTLVLAKLWATSLRSYW